MNILIEKRKKSYVTYISTVFFILCALSECVHGMKKDREDDGERISQCQNNRSPKGELQRLPGGGISYEKNSLGSVLSRQQDIYRNRIGANGFHQAKRVVDDLDGVLKKQKRNEVHPIFSHTTDYENLPFPPEKSLMNATENVGNTMDIVGYLQSKTRDAALVTRCHHGEKQKIRELILKGKSYQGDDPWEIPDDENDFTRECFLMDHLPPNPSETKDDLDVGYDEQSLLERHSFKGRMEEDMAKSFQNNHSPKGEYEVIPGGSINYEDILKSGILERIDSCKKGLNFSLQYELLSCALNKMKKKGSEPLLYHTTDCEGLPFSVCNCDVSRDQKDGKERVSKLLPALQRTIKQNEHFFQNPHLLWNELKQRMERKNAIKSAMLLDHFIDDDSTRECFLMDHLPPNPSETKDDLDVGYDEQSLLERHFFKGRMEGDMVQSSKENDKDQKKEAEMQEEEKKEPS